MKNKKSSVSRIAELREQVGLTQKELSNLVGVTENTIANWEKGRSGIDWIEKLIRLCKALNCDLKSLIDYQPPERELSLEELTAMFNKGLLNNKTPPPYDELIKMYYEKYPKAVSNSNSK
jgi:transcriptional regulator with XRE-family HTH domain